MKHVERECIKTLNYLARVGELNAFLCHLCPEMHAMAEMAKLANQILVSLFPRKYSVQLSIFHSGHFCTAMLITRGHTQIYKNCSKDRAETSYFLSYIVFLHVSSLLKSLSTYINLHCDFSWQLWISTIERFRPSFPHASLQSTKSTKTESKSNH